MLLSNAFKYGELRRVIYSVADIYVYIYTKPQIEHDYLPHANMFGNSMVYATRSGTTRYHFVYNATQ